MNSLDIEREIVEKYVKKHKQERILWELTNAKKRDGVIWKFAGKNIYMVLHHDIFWRYQRRDENIGKYN